MLLFGFLFLSLLDFFIQKEVNDKDNKSSQRSEDGSIVRISFKQVSFIFVVFERSNSNLIN
jgi:hypothetical protein